MRNLFWSWNILSKSSLSSRPLIIRGRRWGLTFRILKKISQVLLLLTPTEKNFPEWTIACSINLRNSFQFTKWIRRNMVLSCQRLEFTSFPMKESLHSWKSWMKWEKGMKVQEIIWWQINSKKYLKDGAKTNRKDSATIWG